MRQPGHKDEQIAGIMRKADKDPIADVAKRHGASVLASRRSASFPVGSWSSASVRSGAVRV